MTPSSGKTKRTVPLLVRVLVPAALLLVTAANVHLVYVAFDSQPDCVPHLKEASKEVGTFRAAKFAC